MLCSLLKILIYPSKFIFSAAFQSISTRQCCWPEGQGGNSKCPSTAHCHASSAGSRVSCWFLAELWNSPTARLWEEKGRAQWGKGRHRTLSLLWGPSTTFNVQHISLVYTVIGWYWQEFGAHLYWTSAACSSLSCSCRLYPVHKLKQPSFPLGKKGFFCPLHSSTQTRSLFPAKLREVEAVFSHDT